ncbi:MAG: PilZ domain-containing protein, partial [Proteobacteria bacterium]|nr:PilZ domain-containing protein [Pseudomonadota bacterium]
MDRVYAATSQSANKLGQINDISMGGLSYTYIDGDRGDEKLIKNSEETVFLISAECEMVQLSSEIIEDYRITNVPSFIGMKVKKRHVKFNDLSSKQFVELSCFLQDNIVKPLENDTIVYD